LNERIEGEGGRLLGVMKVWLHRW